MWKLCIIPMKVFYVTVLFILKKKGAILFELLWSCVFIKAPTVAWCLNLSECCRSGSAHMSAGVNVYKEPFGYFFKTVGFSVVSVGGFWYIWEVVCARVCVRVMCVYVCARDCKLGGVFEWSWTKLWHVSCLFFFCLWGPVTAPHLFLRASSRDKTSGNVIWTH